MESYLLENSSSYATTESLDIAKLMEENPLTRFTPSANNKFLEKIQTIFTQLQQHLFVVNFYCYLNYEEDEFVVDFDNIWKWLGFTRKDNCKVVLEKHFDKDIDYKIFLNESKTHIKKKVIIPAPEVAVAGIFNETCSPYKNLGGAGLNKETIMLNIITFKKLCLKSNTKKADEIHDYYLKLEKIVNETAKEEATELKQRLLRQEQELQMRTQELQLKNDEIQSKDAENKRLVEYAESVKTEDANLIYIYNTDVRIIETEPELKIGATKNVQNRLKPYKQVSKFGRLEMTVLLPHNAIMKTLEHYIHYLLSKYRVSGEVFRINVEEAKCVVLSVVNLSKVIDISNIGERQLKLKQLYEHQMVVINNVKPPAVSTREMSCQTDPIDETVVPESPQTTNPELVEMYAKFDRYITECCVLGENYESTGEEIRGQYRLWSRTATKDLKWALNDYLKRRFKEVRLKIQVKNQLVHGFVGIALKPIQYPTPMLTNDVEAFVYENCVFKPDGKCLIKNVLAEFLEWKGKTNRTVNPRDDEHHLRRYLNTHPQLLPAVVWMHTESNDGYYGLSLRTEDPKFHKTTSSTGKKVEKRDAKTHVVLQTYETIAKAKEMEKCSWLSVAIKQGKVFNDSYYFCVGIK